MTLGLSAEKMAHPYRTTYGLYKNGMKMINPRRNPIYLCSNFSSRYIKLCESIIFLQLRSRTIVIVTTFMCLSECSFNYWTVSYNLKLTFLYKCFNIGNRASCWYSQRQLYVVPVTLKKILSSPLIPCKNCSH